LTKTGRDSNRGGERNQQHFAPPTDHGFDTFFSTEAKTPTWDPLWAPPKHNRKWWDPVSDDKRAPYGTAYWTPKGKVEEPLDGDDSKVIMDQALKFIEKSVENDQPFFTVIWFHAPHLPVVSGKHWTAPYDTLGGYHKHYYGCISALDHQVGRLRKALKDWGLSNDTMLWFCADNGPEGQSFQAPGSAWPLKGRKRSLHDGGVRVPAILEWQGTVSKGARSNVPTVTSDFLPTIADVLGVALPDRPYDGISLKRLIHSDKNKDVGGLMKREIGFQSAKQVAWMRGSFKYYSPDQGKTDYLFDLNEDISESVNLAGKRPDVLDELKSALQAWRESTKLSASGADYQ
jgi:arylsulfatase A-like enzyme